MTDDTEKSSSLPPGTRLGRYEIRSQLGAGGMGVVYLGLDTELGRTVALKILPQGLTPNPKLLSRFIQEAKAKDPNYARAHAGLSDTLGASSVNSWVVPTEGYPKAIAAAEKAVALDDDLAEAHASLGAITMLYQLDWAKAEREYKRAIELNPSHPDTYELYSYLLSATGRLNEAIDVIKRGLALDPLSLPLLDDTGQAYYWARRYDEALQQYRKSIDIDANHPGAYSGVGVVYEQKGMYKEAIEAFQRAIDSTERTSNLLGLLGHAYALSGKRAEALKILDELKQMEKVKYVSPYDLAVLYTGLGEKDDAIEQLNKAYEQRAGWVMMLKTEPLFDPLRSDARFAALVQRLDQKYPRQDQPEIGNLKSAMRATTPGTGTVWRSVCSSPCVVVHSEKCCCPRIRSPWISTTCGNDSRSDIQRVSAIGAALTFYF